MLERCAPRGWRALWPALALAWALCMAFSAPSVRAATVVDDRGVRVTLDAPAQRVVSLLPSLTETVCALGACDRLVAIDDFSNWPSRVQALPRVGGLEDARIEAIVAQRPDVVLLAGSTRALGRLERLGLKVVALEPRTLADMQRVLMLVDTLLGTGRGPALWRETEAALDAATRSLPAAQRGQRVYVEVGSGPYAASASSFVGELLQRLGEVNVVPGELGPFPRLNPEFVVRADPQVMMLANGVEDPAARPGWAGISALRSGRVCRFSPAQADVLVRPGPRVAVGAALMARCLAGRWGERP